MVLAEHGIPFDEGLTVEGDGTLRGGARAMQPLLALSPPPTAVICFNDLTAMGVIHALSQASKKVPRDCSVIGFDDLELAAYYCPPLTTVRQPSYRLGQSAMQMMMQLIQRGSAPQSELLPTKLVVRETTGPASTLASGREGR
jgi:DNA-binding LacI/PurR family transcriptional regulator